MSLTRIASQERLHKNPIHRKKHSGELDVFEATMYYCEPTNATDLDTPKTIRQVLEGRRMSLDINIRNPPQLQPLMNARSNEKQAKEKKHYKQPSSPGAKLASFLNSLFNQKALKKKKSKSTTDSVIEEEGSMRRRSSVSHIGSSLWTIDTASRNSSSSSDFRTTPSYAKNRTKVRKYSDNSHQHKHCIDRDVNSMSSSIQDKILVDADQKRKNMDLSWLDEKLKLIEKKKLMNSCSNSNGSLFKKEKLWVDEDEEDGGESDSSSDLFELQNCDLGLYSNGLPVYETTNIETFKRSGTSFTSSTTHL